MITLSVYCDTLPTTPPFTWTTNSIIQAIQTQGEEIGDYKYVTTYRLPQMADEPNEISMALIEQHFGQIESCDTKTDNLATAIAITKQHTYWAIPVIFAFQLLIKLYLFTQFPMLSKFILASHIVGIPYSVYQLYNSTDSLKAYLSAQGICINEHDHIRLDKYDYHQLDTLHNHGSLAMLSAFILPGLLIPHQMQPQH